MSQSEGSSNPPSQDPHAQQEPSAKEAQQSESKDSAASDPVPKKKKFVVTAEDIGDLLASNTDKIVELLDKSLYLEDKPDDSTDDITETEEDDTSVRVFSKDEVPRVKDLGLGRGVDATDKTPWFNKSSFQVREPDFENLIGTDEGGYLRDYETEVSSVTSQQASMASSIAVAQAPVKIGIEGELSRSVSTTRKVVGKKIVTRTIEFAAKFDDLSLNKDKKKTSVPTFEKRLLTWIGPYKETSQTELENKCLRFVEHFHITHYVSSLTLGATEYLLFSEAEYYTKLSSTSKIGYDPVAQINASSSFSSKFTSKSSDLQKIGRIVDNKVAREAPDEAVIGTEISPIHHLVKESKVQRALQKALADYIRKKKDKTTGPFVIRCGDEKLYWKVHHDNDGYSVIGTNEPENASLFSIFPTDDGDHPFEFYIGWNDAENRQKPTGDSTPPDSKMVEPVFRYLDAPTGIRGRNNGPLYMKSQAKKHNSRFSIRSRLRTIFNNNMELKDWVEGKDSFFIMCNRRYFRNDGLIAMRSQSGRPQLGCVSSTKYHNERDVWMVFRLLSPEIDKTSGLCVPSSENQGTSNTPVQQSSQHTATPGYEVTGTSPADEGKEAIEMKTYQHLKT